MTFRQIRITGLDGADYEDKVEDLARRRQDGPLQLSGETDRVYYQSGVVTVHDPVLGRRLVVEKSGSAATVTWNPWADKGAALADVAQDEWATFVCVEAANVREAAVVIPPDSEHTLHAGFRVETD